MIKSVYVFIYFCDIINHSECVRILSVTLFQGDLFCIYLYG